MRKTHSRYFHVHIGVNFTGIDVDDMLLLHVAVSNTTYLSDTSRYGMATISRLLKIVGLFCKRAYNFKEPTNHSHSAKETYNFKEPTNHSHQPDTSLYTKFCC